MTATIKQTMSQPTVRIAYAGPALSGRTTALQDALSRSRSDAAHKNKNMNMMGYPTTYTFAWPLPVPTQVEAFVPSAIAKFWHEPGTEPTNERAREELQQLRSVDGVLFVWDVQHLCFERNVHAMKAQIHGRPTVCLVNKRDLPSQSGDDELRAALGEIPYVDGVATKGVGCSEALTQLLEMIQRRTV